MNLTTFIFFFKDSKNILLLIEIWKYKKKKKKKDLSLSYLLCMLMLDGHNGIFGPMFIMILCLVYMQKATPVVHEETGPSEANIFSSKFIIDPNQAPANEVKPIAGLQKIFWFRLLHEGDVQDATSEPVDI
ncbi:hypothetical protein PVL29_025413 [Vitis rotundifolia]|uniref:Uncharacterized protein n=1 Tax=Vitis rotundifolia TaxID=103349 RepID=A0AA38YJM7_VITRO|nr:hypothetical protein PVL29_025413 [Vitis rotundifolia]